MRELSANFNYLGAGEPATDETSYYAKISVNDTAICSSGTAASLVPSEYC